MSERVVVRVGDFLPSRHGFRFSNDFPSGPVVKLRLLGLPELCFGDASCGLCGGMSFAVRDYFVQGRPVPDSNKHPAPGSPLFKYLVRRLWDSFRLPGGPFRYYAWMRLPDVKIWQRTLSDSWPRVRRELDRGRLAPLGMNRYRSRNPMHLGHNHQILAYGYEWDRDSGDVLIQIYDPDYSNEDDLTFAFNVNDVEGKRGIVYSKGATVRGFFTTPYKPPGFAWCSFLFGLHCPL